MHQGQAGLRQIRTPVRNRAPRTASPPPPAIQSNGGWWDPRFELRSSFTRSGYLDAVERVRDYIFAGDIFQANLSQRFEAPLDASRRGRSTAAARHATPAPFAAFLETPEVPRAERVARALPARGRDGHVETRPIKGTRPRGVGPEHDAALGQALAESAKDRAENLMIVDLMRNDLSRVCAPGSVRVSELFALERYATVHHLVSTVVGELSAGHDALDLLRAAFPGGSITGAPKLRAMEIIAELEPSRRGVYCGSIGYWSVTGELDTSIAIRTAVVRDGRVYFSAGGGIVADSDPEQEYRETLDKARGLIDALAAIAVMILVIDNYDSFVYNLARYVRELGGERARPPQRRADPRRDRGAGAEPHHHLAGALHAARSRHLHRRRRRFGRRRRSWASASATSASARLWRRRRARGPADARQDVAHHARRLRASSRACRRRCAWPAITRW